MTLQTECLFDRKYVCGNRNRNSADIYLRWSLLKNFPFSNLLSTQKDCSQVKKNIEMCDLVVWKAVLQGKFIRKLIIKYIQYMVNNKDSFKLLLLLITISFATSKSKYPPAYSEPPSDPSLFTPFPRKVWAYWDAGLTNAKLWTQLCINNMRHFSEVSGWEFFFLTDQNFTDYLTPASVKHITELFTMQSTYSFEKTSKSDVIRVFLLRDHGGIWIDANSFFINDFAWLDRLYEQPYVYNRFFPDPQVLSYAFSTDISGNKTVVWDDKLGRSVYLHPGMENWVMIAKANSKFFNDVANNFEKCLRLGKKQMDQQNRASGVMFHNEGMTYFYMGNYQFQVALQRTQRRLDAEKGSIKYAVEYYRMWSIEAKYSGLIYHINTDAPQINFIMTSYLLEDIEDIFMFQISPMFIKLVGWVADQMNNVVKDFYNKTCTYKYQRIRKNSLFYKYVVNISSNSPVTDKVKRAFALYEGKDFQTCDELSKPIIKFQVLQTILRWSLIIFLVLLPLMSSLFVIYKQQKPQKSTDSNESELDVLSLKKIQNEKRNELTSVS